MSLLCSCSMQINEPRMQTSTIIDNKDVSISAIEKGTEDGNIQLSIKNKTSIQLRVYISTLVINDMSINPSFYIILRPKEISVKSLKIPYDIVNLSGITKIRNITAHFVGVKDGGEILFLENGIIHIENEDLTFSSQKARKDMPIYRGEGVEIYADKITTRYPPYKTSIPIYVKNTTNHDLYISAKSIEVFDSEIIDFPISNGCVAAHKHGYLFLSADEVFSIMQDINISLLITSSDYSSIHTQTENIHLNIEP